MARFDVFANPDAVERKLIPFFLDVQSDHVKQLDTRIVVPLWAVGSFPPRAKGLNPEFDLAGRTVVMDTAALGAVPLAALRKPTGNLLKEQLTIQNALDILFGSY